MTTNLYVTPDVASLQFDLDTAGTVTLISSVAATKTLSTNLIGSLTRVLIFGMTSDEFSGLFATVSDVVASVSGTVGARADATDASAVVYSVEQVVTPPSPPVVLVPSGTATLIQFFNRVALDLHEESFLFESEGWTQAEMMSYLNKAESLFLQRTGMLKTDSTETMTPGTTILFDRPANTIDIDRLSVNGKALRRQASWDLERENRSWRQTPNGSPSYWHEDNLDASQYELDKRPAAGGTIRIFADYLPDPYVDILSESIHLQNTWEPYLRWKVLSLALGREGDQQDLGRSRYADQRFRFGVYLARRLMSGNPAVVFPSD